LLCFQKKLRLAVPNKAKINFPAILCTHIVKPSGNAPEVFVGCGFCRQRKSGEIFKPDAFISFDKRRIEKVNLGFFEQRTRDISVIGRYPENNVEFLKNLDIFFYGIWRYSNVSSY